MRGLTDLKDWLCYCHRTMTCHPSIKVNIHFTKFNSTNLACNVMEFCCETFFHEQQSVVKTWMNHLVAYLKDTFPLIVWRFGYKCEGQTFSGGSDIAGCRRKQWTSSSDRSKEAGVWARRSGRVSTDCFFLLGRPECSQTLAQQLRQPPSMVGE